MSMPGMWEMIVILAIVLVFFGGRKLPGLGSAIGESIKNFKKGISSDSDEQKKHLADSAAKSPGESRESSKEKV